ncbi:MAG: GH25 family lysozyme [Pyrinomonadaceae bacterium]
MSAPEIIEGIDVSRWQSQVDYSRVARVGIKYVLCKATQSLHHVDPLFGRNWAGIKAAGLIRGAYHFASPMRPAIEQADFFARTVGALDAGDLPLVLDIEDANNLPPIRVARWVSDFVLRLQQTTGRDPIIYTTASFWKDHCGLVTLGHLPLWVAHYTNAQEPILPRGWDNYTFWQYTQAGHVDGVTGNVDRNHFLGSLDDLRRLAGENPSPDIIPEPPPPAPVLQENFRVLKIHSHGDDVRDFQNDLAAIGYLKASEVDGDFGPHTKAAVEMFQLAMGLDDDGAVGIKTRDALNDAIRKQG